MKSHEWAFSKLFLFNLVLTVFIYAPTFFLQFLGYSWIYDPKWKFVFWILPQAFCFYLFLSIVKRHYLFSWSKSIQFFGFKRPNAVQITISIFCLIPIFLGYLSSYKINVAKDYSFLVMPNWCVELSMLSLGAGVFEEIFQRGFFFHCLRRDRSFISAVTLSGLLWSMGHLPNILSYGFTQGVYSIVLSFFFAFPSAFIFERGGNNIWGWMLVHVGMDSVAVVGFQRPEGFINGLPYFDSWVGVIIAGVIVFPLTNWLLPKQKLKLP